MPFAHRNGDLRACGATTIVQGQSTVFVNSKLWSVVGDPNSHGDGQLINSGTSVTIHGKPVIVNRPDLAAADDAPHPSPQTETAQGSTNVSAYS